MYVWVTIGSKPACTPSDPSLKLHNDGALPYEDISSYRRLVGWLLYLNTTRPDITYITQQLSQFLSAPTHTHHTVALRFWDIWKIVQAKAYSSLEILLFIYKDIQMQIGQTVLILGDPSVDNVSS